MSCTTKYGYMPFGTTGVMSINEAGGKEKVTEKEKLQTLVDEGFQAQLTLRTPSLEEMKLRGVPQLMWDKKVRALPLWHEDGRKIMFYMKDPETIDYAQQLVNSQKAVVGYHLRVFCSAIGPDTTHGRMTHLDRVIESLKDVMGWDVRESDYPNVMEIHFEIPGDNEDAVEQHLAEVSKIALLLSLKNRLGFAVKDYSPGPRYKGQPYAVNIGLQERLAEGTNSQGQGIIDQIWEHTESAAAAAGLQSMYSQITDNSRIMTGWAAIEEIFSGKPEHILERTERDNLVKIVREVDFLRKDKTKQTKITDVLRNADLMAKDNRNERIAGRISELLGVKYEEVYARVRSIAETRGKLVHQLTASSDNVREQVEFIERVLWEYIENNHPGARETVSTQE